MKVINYDFGTEYHIIKNEVLESIILICNDTIYLWTNEYTQVFSTVHDVNMIYSDLFGLRFMNDEPDHTKELLRMLLLDGMKANHNIATYDMKNTLTNHKKYYRTGL